jgi:hypothetical protein
VLDRLEGADRTAELLTLVGVSHRRVQAVGGQADEIRGQGRAAGDQTAAQRGDCGCALREHGALGVIERECSHRAKQIEAAQALDPHPAGRRGDLHEHGSPVALGPHQNEVGFRRQDRARAA